MLYEVITFIGFFIFRGSLENIWQVAGMLVGVYTGGTPNLAAMKTALNVSQELYLMTHTYDLIFSAVFLVFILSIGQRVFLWFLPPFKHSEKKETDGYESYNFV